MPCPHGHLSRFLKGLWQGRQVWLISHTLGMFTLTGAWFYRCGQTKGRSKGQSYSEKHPRM